MALAAEIQEYPEFRRQVVPNFAQTKSRPRFQLVEPANRPISGVFLLSLLRNAAVFPARGMKTDLHPTGAGLRARVLPPGSQEDFSLRSRA
jgi:hypothetical protein